MRLYFFLFRIVYFRFFLILKIIHLIWLIILQLIICNISCFYLFLYPKKHRLFSSRSFLRICIFECYSLGFLLSLYLQLFSVLKNRSNIWLTFSSDFLFLIKIKLFNFSYFDLIFFSFIFHEFISRKSFIFYLYKDVFVFLIM